MPHIPVELLCGIAEFLDRKSLLKFSLAFQEARSAAQHVLFRVYASHPNAESYHDVTKDGRSRHYLFARSICTNPSLATKVQEINIRWWPRDAELKKMDPRWYSSKRCSHNTYWKAKELASELFIPAAVGAGLTDQNEVSLIPNFDVSPPPWTLPTVDRLHGFEFLNHLREGRDEALVLFIIALLPNLRSLKIDSEFTMATHRALFHWPCILTRSLTARTKLKAPTSLKSIVLDYPERERVTLTADLLATFPTLEIVELHHIRILPGTTTNLAQTNPRLLEMSLAYCTGSRTTSNLFSNLPGLTKFELIDFPDMRPYDIDQVLRNLRPSQSTLRSLQLFTVNPNHAVGQRSQCSTDSLVEFKELTTLSTAYDFFFTYDTPELELESVIVSDWMNLPPSLEELHLHYSKVGIGAYIKTLIRLRGDGLFPRLKEVFVYIELWSSDPIVQAVIYELEGRLAEELRQFDTNLFVN